MGRGPGRCAAAIGTSAILLAGCTAASYEPEAHLTGDGPYGMGVEMTVRLPGDRMLLAGRFEVAGAARRADFYRNDLDDVEPTRSLALPGGTPVMVSASGLLPPCDKAAAEPAVLVISSSRSDGSRVEDRFAVADAAEVNGAVRQWCAAGLRSALAHYSIAPTGEATVRILLTNPGPEQAEVTSRAWRERDARWARASVKVAAGTNTMLVVHATGVDCEAPTTGPWDHGLLVLTDGRGGPRTLPLLENMELC